MNSQSFEIIVKVDNKNLHKSNKSPYLNSENSKRKIIKVKKRITNIQIPMVDYAAENIQNHNLQQNSEHKITSHSPNIKSFKSMFSISHSKIHPINKSYIQLRTSINTSSTKLRETRTNWLRKNTKTLNSVNKNVLPAQKSIFDKIISNRNIASTQTNPKIVHKNTYSVNYLNQNDYTEYVESKEKQNSDKKHKHCYSNILVFHNPMKNIGDSKSKNYQTFYSFYQTRDMYKTKHPLFLISTKNKSFTNQFCSLGNDIRKSNNGMNTTKYYRKNRGDDTTIMPKTNEEDLNENSAAQFENSFLTEYCTKRPQTSMEKINQKSTPDKSKTSVMRYKKNKNIMEMIKTYENSGLT